MKGKLMTSLVIVAVLAMVVTAAASVYIATEVVKTREAVERICPKPRSKSGGLPDLPTLPALPGEDEVKVC